MSRPPPTRRTRRRRQAHLVIALVTTSTIVVLGYAATFRWAAAWVWRQAYVGCYCGGVQYGSSEEPSESGGLRVDALPADFPYVPYWWHPTVVTYGGTPRRAVFLPLWPVMVLLFGGTWLAWRRLRQLGGDGCEQCGYSLRGNLSGRCPECGAVVADMQCDRA